MSKLFEGTPIKELSRAFDVTPQEANVTYHLRDYLMKCLPFDF